MSGVNASSHRLFYALEETDYEMPPEPVRSRTRKSAGDRSWCVPNSCESGY